MKNIIDVLFIILLILGIVGMLGIFSRNRSQQTVINSNLASDNFDRGFLFTDINGNKRYLLEFKKDNKDGVYVWINTIYSEFIKHPNGIRVYSSKEYIHINGQNEFNILEMYLYDKYGKLIDREIFHDTYEPILSGTPMEFVQRYIFTTAGLRISGVER